MGAPPRPSAAPSTTGTRELAQKTFGCGSARTNSNSDSSCLTEESGSENDESTERYNIKPSNNDEKKSPKRRADDQEASITTGIRSEEAQTKLKAQREYNRVSAARARKRQKGRISDLEEKVKEASDEVGEYQKRNDVLHAQVAMLVEQNKMLLTDAADKPPVAEVQVQTQSQPSPLASLLDGFPLHQLLQIAQALERR